MRYFKLFCHSIILSFTISNIHSSLIPLNLLVKDSDISTPIISPDGKKVAFLAPYLSAKNIWIKDLDTSNIYNITTEARSIKKYFWSYDNNTILYFKDHDGDENWNLYSVNSITREAKNLTPFADVQVKLICYSRKYPDLVLIAMNKEEKHLHDLYQVNIITGELTLVEKNPGFIAGFDMEAAWYADDNLNARIAYNIDDNGSTIVLYRMVKEDKWQPLVTWDVNASAVSSFVGFYDSDNVYFADASESNTSSLVKINLKTKEKTIIAQDQIYDIINGSLDVLYNEDPTFFKDPITNEILAVFLECDTLRTIILNNSIREDIETLERLCKGKLRIRSADDSFEKWIVMFVNSNSPNEYYIYNRFTKELQPIINEKESILNYRLAETKPINFIARDGLTIHGYLTYPTNTNDLTSLPVVLLVHGGPWMRDTWEFNKEVQFLTNRGYACMQINFRASSGYGKSFVKAGNKEYGRAMQYDLNDGIKWLIDQNIADPKRIAIMGWSYGGYAALAGATFTSDLYTCAIDIYGRSNLVTNAQSIPPYWQKSAVVWKYRRGDPITEEKMLKERSPLFNADKINIPMFIAHGAHDVRIKQTDSDLIVAALRQRNISCEYLLFSNEGHGLSNVQNRSELYASIENFLARYIGNK